MYKKDLALNDLQWSVCHKTQPKHILSWCPFQPHVIHETSYPSRLLFFIALENEEVNFMMSSL